MRRGGRFSVKDGGAMADVEARGGGCGREGIVSSGFTDAATGGGRDRDKDADEREDEAEEDADGVLAFGTIPVGLWFGERGMRVVVVRE